jgi:ABC-type molybdate transport system substrate-binding protein
VAASPRELLSEVTRRFGRPGVRVELVLGASNELAPQIEPGTPVRAALEARAVRSLA